MKCYRPKSLTTQLPLIVLCSAFSAIGISRALEGNATGLLVGLGFTLGLTVTLANAALTRVCVWPDHVVIRVLSGRRTVVERASGDSVSTRTVRLFGSSTVVSIRDGLAGRQRVGLSLMGFTPADSRAVVAALRRVLEASQSDGES